MLLLEALERVGREGRATLRAAAAVAFQEAFAVFDYGRVSHGKRREVIAVGFLAGAGGGFAEAEVVFEFEVHFRGVGEGEGGGFGGDFGAVLEEEFGDGEGFAGHGAGG